MANRTPRISHAESANKLQRPRRTRESEGRKSREIRTPDLTLINKSSQPFNDLEVAELTEAYIGLGPITIVKLGKCD